VGGGESGDAEEEVELEWVRWHGGATGLTARIEGEAATRICHRCARVRAAQRDARGSRDDGLGSSSTGRRRGRG
jgi:hypothetical protein